MPLEPSIRKRLDERAQAGIPRVETMTPTQIRGLLDALVRKQAPVTGPDLVITDCDIPSDGAQLPLRIYQPAQGERLPVLVYFHGGGWLNGTLDSHNRICSYLARESGSVVVSVGYRRAPENPFPAATHDAMAATSWVFAQAEHLRGDADRILTAGDSAGGNLATVVCLMRRDQGLPGKLAGQILLWPVTNYYEPATASYLEFAEHFGLTRKGMSFFWDQYLSDPKDARNPYTSVLCAPDLQGLPRALVVTAEYDILRDEGNAYAERLAASGVPVEHVCVAGVNHGFAAWPDTDFSLPQAVETRQRIARFIAATRP
jgi:acetyl esterase